MDTDTTYIDYVMPVKKEYSFLVNDSSFIPHTVSFCNSKNEHIGTLDFSGETLTFTGKADESAKIFIDYLSKYFSDFGSKK